MNYTRALYYPWIEFADDEWLKNSLLYWDHVQSITPDSFKMRSNPYDSPTARYFFDEGIVSPLYVSPRSPELRGIEEDFFQSLNTFEGQALLSRVSDGSFARINLEKLPHGLRYGIHPDKFPYTMDSLVADWYEPEPSGSGGWVRMEAGLSQIYMTLLTARLAGHHHSAPVTDSQLPESLYLASQARGAAAGSEDYFNDRRMRAARGFPEGPIELAHAFLVNTVLEGIRIDPDTPAERIIDFRRRHSTEIARFRCELQELSGTLKFDNSLQALQSAVRDIYINRISPAAADLKAALKSERISFLTDAFMKVAFFALPTTSIPLAALGLSLPQALLLGTGVSIVAGSVLYSTRRANALRASPYSYLLQLDREFKPSSATDG